MQIVIPLKRLLDEYGLDRHGVVNEIADALGVHRHTVGKLYRNQSSNPSLAVLGAICDWLIQHNVPASELPHRLFAAAPSGLWRALVRPKNAAIYLGEYLRPTRPVTRFVHRRDSTVAWQINLQLTTVAQQDETDLRVDSRYVPFTIADPKAKPKVPPKELAVVERMYGDMLMKRDKCSAVMIGSQRVNHILEHFVADIFKGAKAFSHSDEIRVPFHVRREDPPSELESCFGSTNVPGYKKGSSDGIYYLNAKHEWVEIQWQERRQEAGVVIVRFEPGNNATQLALFGFSSRGTEALGNVLVSQPHKFWTQSVDHKGKRVGVYIVSMKLKHTSEDDLDKEASVESSEIIELDGKMLKQYLA